MNADGSIRSRRGMVLGATIALAVPIGSIVLAQLVQTGVAPVDVVEAIFGPLSVLLWVALAVFGPIGIVVFGWSGGARGVGAWIAVALIGVPLVAWVWFMGAVALSGAMGSPL